MGADTTDVSDTLRAIEEADIANILEKQRAGKPLSETERKRVTAYVTRKEAAARAGASSASDGSGDIRVADSMKAASAMTGFPVEQIEKAKAAGCQAFRGSRVHVGELVEWMRENGDTLPTGNADLDAIQKEIALEKLRKTRFENDVAEGRYIKKDDFASQLLTLGLDLKAKLRKRLEDEYPDKLTQRTRAEVLEVNRMLVDELCGDFQAFAKTWLQTKQLKDLSTR